MKYEKAQNQVELKTQNGNFRWGSKAEEWVLFAGPDIYESDDLVFETAERLQKITKALSIPWIFKCSFDKANRSSSKSFRGPGMAKALQGLENIKKKLGVSIVTDLHDPSQVDAVCEVADVVQIPAFLCRQTDLLQSAAKKAKVLNIKKGQFLAPWDMKEVLLKCEEAGQKNLLLCERGSSFGYNYLVSDMTGLQEMKNLGYPVVMDATHSVQLPGGRGSSSGGRRDMIGVLARAAFATGAVDGLFLECHPNPDKALCDGPIATSLDDLEALLKDIQSIRRVLFT